MGQKGLMSYSSAWRFRPKKKREKGGLVGYIDY